MDFNEILESPEKTLLLTEEQMKELIECRDKLIQKFKEVPDDDIESGKLTEQDATKWIEEFQLESIAITRKSEEVIEDE